MSYNPNRQAAGARRSQRTRRLDPRAGHKASDIVRQRGPQAATINDIQSKQNTSRGWKVEIHKGDQFEMLYEYICSRNATGVVRHEEMDRALRVLSGELYITVGETTAVLKAGDSYSLPAGMEYQIGTSGSFDTEVLFCQGADYEETLEQLTPPQAINTEMLMRMPEEESRSHTSFDPISRAKAQEHAQRLAHEKHQREVARRQAAMNKTGAASSEPAADGSVAKTPPPTKRAPLPGQQVQGVNPRPVGAGGYGGE